MKAKGANHQNYVIGAVFFTLLMDVACSLSNSALPVVTQCTLPSDQTGTLNGRWSSTPIPIAISTTSNFNAGEVQAIEAAANTWNTFTTDAQSITPLDYGGSSIRTSASADPFNNLCSQSIIATGGYSAPVVIYKVTNWTAEASHTSGLIALTTTCYVTSSNLTIKPFQMAVLELNYQNFFVSGQMQPDLQSIVTHELGHVLGLRHSCESSPPAGEVTPNCAEANLPSDYYSAVMYPVFGFTSNGQGQVKQALGSNDEGRDDCLYGSTAM